MMNVRWNLPYTLRELLTMVGNCNDFEELANVLEIYQEELAMVYPRKLTCRLISSAQRRMDVLKVNKEMGGKDGLF